MQTGEHTGGEHLGAQRVGLQLAEVGLRRSIPRISGVLAFSGSGTCFLSSIEGLTYRKIPSLRLSTSQSLADAVRQVLGLAAGVRDRANGLLLEFDRHAGL